jgi:hypothetical protein
MTSYWNRVKLFVKFQEHDSGKQEQVSAFHKRKHTLAVKTQQSAYFFLQLFVLL